jgi:hypothetical protein
LALSAKASTISVSSLPDSRFNRHLRLTPVKFRISPL